MTTASPRIVDARRIGFLADTHCQAVDGSDLPQAAMDAFAGVDLIVHLGDVGKDGVLTRLGTLAPVVAPTKGTCEVLEASGLRVGITFDITKPGLSVTVGEGGLDLQGQAAGEVAASKFGPDVDVVAFGGTHRMLEETHEGVLFFNPGSARLPSDRQGEDDLGSVAVLDLSSGKPSVSLIRLRRA